MKPNPDMTKAQLLEGLMSQGGNDELPERIGDRPGSYEERVKAQEGMLKAIQERKILLQCHGCGAGINAFDDEWAACECGGFICVNCRRLETEGECPHEPPSILAEPL